MLAFNLLRLIALVLSLALPVLAPAGTTRYIVNRFSAESAKAVHSADIKGRFESLSIEALGNSPEQAGKFLEDEIAKWARVIPAGGVKAE